MKVRTLIGRNYGQIIDLPYAIATAALANGTAALPEEDVVNVRGRSPIVGGAVEDVEENRMMTAPQSVTKRGGGRRKRVKDTELPTE